MPKYILSIIVVLFIAGCSEDKEADRSTELFAGELTITRIEIPYVRTDFINFTVYGRSYHLDHINKESNLCDSYGNLAGFGTNKLIFLPDTTLPSSNCDNIRIPRGEYDAIFKGASLELGPKIETLYIEIDENTTDVEIWKYHFVLTQQ